MPEKLRKVTYIYKLRKMCLKYSETVDVFFTAQ